MKKAPHLDALLDRLQNRVHTAIATNRSNTMNRVLTALLEPVVDTRRLVILRVLR